MSVPEDKWIEITTLGDSNSHFLRFLRGRVFDVVVCRRWREVEIELWCDWLWREDSLWPD